MSADLPLEDETKWRRRLGSGANNRAWELSEQLSRTRDEDDEMLHAAHAAAYLWKTVGTVRNAASANLLLGQVHSLLGIPDTASRYATAALEFFISNNGAPWELAFAHAVAANAAHCSGNAALHQAEYAAAQLALEDIAGARDKEIVLATLRVVPKPSGSGLS